MVAKFSKGFSLSFFSLRQKKGYERIFSIHDEEDDDFDDEYPVIEKFGHKKNYID